MSHLKYPPMLTETVILIFLSGLAAAAGQVILLRELLVLFGGNELSTGIILSCWLLWTATGSVLTGRLRWRRAGITSMILGLALFCAALPAAVIWVRAARFVWSIPPGELIGFGAMTAIALSATGPVCFISGGLFALGWGICGQSRETAGSGTIRVYLAEAAGSGVGGLVFFFVLLPFLSPLAGAVALSAALATCILVVAAVDSSARRRPRLLAVLGLLLASCAVLVFSGDINAWTRRLQWGPSYLDSIDTPYHNVALLRKSEQFSLFSNGIWLYSTPDPYTSEPAAHVTLLQHRDPQNVLLLGDYSPGLPDAVLKHGGVKRVDCVQPDEKLAAFMASAVPGSLGETGDDKRLTVFHADPRRFVQSAAPGSYDVIILSGGEPLNAEMNRFYTVEFFGSLRSLLRPGGVVSFGIPAAPDILGAREALLLKSLDMTLRKSFDSVLVVPGETVRFLAARARDVLTRDPEVLVERLRSRGIEAPYVRDFHLRDLMEPMRLAYLDAVLSGSMPARINSDLRPSCYLYGIAVWSAQAHPRAGRMLGALLEEKGRAAVLGGLVLIMLPAALALRKIREPSTAIAFNTAVGGAAVIVSEIVLILLFQIVYGTVYERIALIVSAFMAGMALGSGLASFVRSGDALKRLRVSQAALAVYSGLFFVVLTAFPAGDLSRAGEAGAVLFLLAALTGGALGGMQFAFAAASVGRDKGATLYAADLAGAAAGAIAASLLFLPLFGIRETMLILTLTVAAGLLALRRRP